MGWLGQTLQKTNQYQPSLQRRCQQLAKNAWRKISPQTSKRFRHLPNSWGTTQTMLRLNNSSSDHWLSWTWHPSDESTRLTLHDHQRLWNAVRELSNLLHEKTVASLARSTRTSSRNPWAVRKKEFEWRKGRGAQKKKRSPRKVNKVKEIGRG